MVAWGGERNPGERPPSPHIESPEGGISAFGARGVEAGTREQKSTVTQALLGCYALRTSLEIPGIDWISGRVVF